MSRLLAGLFLFLLIPFVGVGQTLSVSVNGVSVNSTDTVQICVNSSSSFSTSHSGIGSTPSFLWSIQNESLADSTLQSFSYSISDTGTYEIIVYAFGTDTLMQSIYADVNPILATVNLTGPDTICHNSIPSIIVDTLYGGIPPYSYQWERSVSGSGVWVTVGTNSSSYTELTNLTSTTEYRVTVSSSQGCGSVLSPSYTVVVRPDVVPSVVSGVQTICYGSTAGSLTRSAATGSDGSFTYDWQESLNGVSGWSSVGSSSTTLNPGVLTSSRWYRVSCTSVCGVEYSNVIKVNVRNPISSGVFSPTTSEICYNTGTTLSVGSASGGDSVYSYVWERRLPGGSWSVSPGSTSSLTHSTGSLLTTMEYRVICSSGCNVPDTSNTYVVDVAQEFMTGSVLTSNNTDSICFGEIPPGLLANGFNGGRLPYTYTWEFSNSSQNWTTVGTNSPSYQENAPQYENAHYRVKVESSQGCGMRVSDSIRIKVNPLPAFDSTIISGPNVICKGAQGKYYRIFPESNDSIVWSLSSGTVVSKMTDRVFIDFDSIPSLSVDTLKALITNRRTLCQREIKLPLSINNSIAPTKTEIVWKAPSNILVCSDSTAGLIYSWGYLSRSTGIKHVVQTSNLRYCQYLNNIDTSQNLYYVTLKNQGCSSTSYYGDNSQALTVDESSVNEFIVYPNPSTGNLSVSGNLKIVEKLYLMSMDGKKWDFIPDSSIGNEWNLMLNQPAGIYYLYIVTDTGVIIKNITIVP